MRLCQATFEANAPILTRSEASTRAMQALVEMLDQQSEKSLSEPQKRKIFLSHGLWLPSKKHWLMEQTPHYRSAEKDGKLVPLRSSAA